MTTETTQTPETLLVVDDEKDLADQIARHLKFLGYKVDTAICAEQALEMMEQ